jgi:hypothetical protein
VAVNGYMKMDGGVVEGMEKGREEDDLRWIRPAIRRV